MWISGSTNEYLGLGAAHQCLPPPALRLGNDTTTHRSYLAPLFERVGDVDLVVGVMWMYLGVLHLRERAR